MLSRLGERLLCRDHAVLHEPIDEGAVHDLQAPRVADHLPPEMRAADDGPRVPHARPDRLPPRRDGLLRPVLEDDVVQLAGGLGEWTHPYFISVQEYGRIAEATGKLDDVVLEDWAQETIPAWRHSIWAGVWDP